MPADAPPPRLAAAFLRIGGFAADAVFLAQLLALCGFFWWRAGASDLAGFSVIGGSVAGMLGVFSFGLFGFISWFWGAAAFWRTLHPPNLALAMIFAASYYALVYGYWMAQTAAAAGGALLAAACWRALPNHPRAWLALCLALMSLRYALPWRYSGIAAAGMALFVLAAWARAYCNEKEKSPAPSAP